MLKILWLCFQWTECSFFSPNTFAKFWRAILADGIK